MLLRDEVITVYDLKKKNNTVNILNNALSIIIMHSRAYTFLS